MARTLSFHATRIETDGGAEEITTLSFVVEADGDPSVYFTMVAEDEDAAEVRVSWGDGKEAREECVLALASASLAAARFKAAFAEPRPAAMGPYGAVEVTFDELEEDDARSAAGALSTLVKGLGARLAITLPGVSLTALPKIPDFPRRHGAPVLGLLSKDAWKTRAGEPLALSLTLSNGGGPLEGGIVVEVAGAALEKGCIEPRSVNAAGAEASFERKGNVASARVTAVRLPADLDVDRRADKKAPKPPALSFTLTIAGKSVGSALLTVRVLPASRNDRAGSAMVGRPVVVEA